MFKNFMPEVEPHERLQMLKDNCDSHEEAYYHRELTQHDLDVKRESYSTTMITLDEHEQVLLKAKEEFKLVAKPLKKVAHKLLTEIRLRREEFEGTVYSFADHDKGIMISYDGDGQFVSSRRLRPDEKQSKMFSLPNANSK